MWGFAMWRPTPSISDGAERRPLHAVVRQPYVRRLHCAHLLQRLVDRGNHDKPKAVTAAAHKLARLIYAMLTKGEEYTDQGQAYFEERYRQRVLLNLKRRAQQIGMMVVPDAPAAAAA